jgi:3-dehydroquinate synthase
MTALINYRFSVADPQTEVHFEQRLPADLHGAANRVVVFDANTARLFGARVPDPVVLDDRDRAKHWASVERVLLAAVDRGMDRGGEIVGIGGGAVCDVAAFAASIYLRGVRLTLVPTTVTAMVDAALGGKTGINLSQGKNLVGTFYPAHRLVVLPHAVRHLSSSDYLDGLAEVIKTAMLGDGALFGMLECRRTEVLERNADLVEEFVRRCLAVKARFVAHDLREELGTAVRPDGTSRAFLNLGHTFAHALESASGFAWSHGAAVAWGIGRSMRLGRILDIVDAGYAQRVIRLLRAYGFRLCALEVDADRLLSAMYADKKRSGDELRFVLQRGLEQTELRAVPVDAVRESLRCED